MRSIKNLIDRITINEHSSIRIESEDGVIIYFDPYNIPEANIAENIAMYSHDADVIFITHSHYDHFSPEDIEKIITQETTIVAPKSMESEIRAYEGHEVVLLAPGEEKRIGVFDVKAVPAYNVGKAFHTKDKNWLGYIVNVDGKNIYVCGDTDINEEIESEFQTENINACSKNVNEADANCEKVADNQSTAAEAGKGDAAEAGDIHRTTQLTIVAEAGKGEAAETGKRDITNKRCDVLLVPCGGTYTMAYKEAAELANIIKPEIAIPTHYGTVAGASDCGEKFAKLVNEGIKTVVLI